MLATTVDRHVPFIRPIQDWEQDSSIDFQGRLVQIGYAALELEAPHSYSSSSPYGYPLSILSSSSMAPIVHQSHASNASDYPPSLHSCHTQSNTITDSSISTSLADQCAGKPLLDEVDGVLMQQLAEANTPEYECVFWFLNCSYVSRIESEWNTHCLSHFRGKNPPRAVQCPLCAWQTICNEGPEAWNLKMEHLASTHLAYGWNLRAARPDFDLFQYLWQQRLIGDQDLKELKGGNHNLTHPPENFVETNGRGSHRQRNSGLQGLQHIRSRRAIAS
ncbi:hypothetical protein BU25DRAFT_274017 [Macroventuria anomochaeta]|uniref:Uncharacterized protein n=1 Tax=Macroventuria anomochaeta TaxID=301207 RepID=A0ACB6S721_9PLEO|nr:uncharacterized protein BU25DRAFT_274017 [Macroventuria anomochaeta]KAF2629773.1 hypothetical protein BU25DRAFT_274017 [Macroventuria anomochaeta]